MIRMNRDEVERPGEVDPDQIRDFGKNPSRIVDGVRPRAHNKTEPRDLVWENADG